MSKLLYVLPRALAILMSGFFGIFILEGFSPGFGLGDALSHLMLALAVVAATILAWKWPKYGGWIFIILGLRGASPLMRGDWESVAMLSLVPLLAGILFIREGFAKQAPPKVPAVPTMLK